MTVFSDPTTGSRCNEERIQRILHEAMLASREAKPRNALSTEEVLDFAKKVLKSEEFPQNESNNSETQGADNKEAAGFIVDTVEGEREIVQDIMLEEKARKVYDAIEMMRALQNGDANDIDDLSRQTSADESIFESTDLLKDAGPIDVSKMAGERKTAPRHAKFADIRREDEFELGLTESEVASFEGLPKNLRSHWKEGESQQEQILQRLDGVKGRDLTHVGSISRSTTTELQTIRSMEEYIEEEKGEPSSSFFDSWPLSYLWGTSMSDDHSEGRRQGRGWRHNNDDTLSLLSCNMIRKDERLPAMTSSLVRVTSMPPPPSYAETIRRTEVDPRMQLWVESQWAHHEKPPSDGAYYLGKSRTVVVHEIARGDWTWCTEWSPKGDRLAVATENHHLAVIDTTSSTVWRVIHDIRMRRPPKKDTTHSIRAIAWGSRCIAIGGTGNAVSILSPEDPYHVIHTIKGTGFVGSLDWNTDCSVLAVGSRLD